MNKRNRGRKFSRKVGPRKQLFKSLANSLVLHEKMKTTEAKAKEIRSVVEKMITRAKDGDVFARRMLVKELTPAMTKKIVEVIAPKYKDRNGGYTRIIKLGPRNSDGAKMVIIELVK